MTDCRMNQRQKLRSGLMHMNTVLFSKPSAQKAMNAKPEAASICVSGPRVYITRLVHWFGSSGIKWNLRKELYIHTRLKHRMP